MRAFLLAVLAFCASVPAQLTVGNVTFPAGSQLSATTWNGQPAIVCVWAPNAALFVTVTAALPGSRLSLDVVGAGFLHDPAFPVSFPCITRLDRGFMGLIIPQGFWSNAYAGNPAFYTHGSLQPVWEEGLYNIGYGNIFLPPSPCPLVGGGTAQRPDVAALIFVPTIF